MPYPVGPICRTFNTVIQLLIFVQTGCMIVSAPFCAMYYNSLSYRLDFLGTLANPVIITIMFLVYALVTLAYIVVLFLLRIRAPELELDIYMNKRSKNDAERQHLLTHEHGLWLGDEHHRNVYQPRFNTFQSIFIRFFKQHNIIALVLFLLPWLFSLILACYYYAPFNPIRTRTIKPYQTLAYWNASTSVQVVWNKDKSRDNKLLLFKENRMPSGDEMANSSLWDEYLPSERSNQRYVVFDSLTPGTSYYYYVPSFTSYDELSTLHIPSVDARPTIAVISDLDSSPYITKLLTSHLLDKNPDLTVILGNAVKRGDTEGEWLLLMQTRGVFKLFHSCPAVALPGLKETKESLFTPNRHRYFYSLVFLNPQVTERSSETNTSAVNYPRELHYTDEDLQFIPENLRAYYKEEEMIPSHKFETGEYSYYIYGKVALILLDSLQELSRSAKYRARPGSFLTVRQINWLVSVLESDEVKSALQRVLFIPVPLYSTGEKAGASLLAELLEPLICKYRISAVLAGDSRLYEIYSDNATCKDYGADHTFLHVTVGSCGAPPASMRSLFLGRRRWLALEYPDPTEIVDQDTDKRRTRLYARSAFTYAMLSIGDDSGKMLSIVAHDVITGEVVHEMLLDTK